MRDLRNGWLQSGRTKIWVSKLCTKCTHDIFDRKVSKLILGSVGDFPITSTALHLKGGWSQSKKDSKLYLIYMGHSSLLSIQGHSMVIRYISDLSIFNNLVLGKLTTIGALMVLTSVYVFFYCYELIPQQIVEYHLGNFATSRSFHKDFAFPNIKPNYSK